MKTLRLLFCAAAILAPLAASAQQAREPKAGDRFTYDLGPINDIHEIVSVTATQIDVKSNIFGLIKIPRSISGPWSWSGGGSAIRYEEVYFGAAPSLLPIEVGKTASASGTSHAGRSEFHFVKTCKVPERKSMILPAGTFDVFTIRCDMRILAGENSYRIYHYAPALGYWAAWQNTVLAKLIEYKLVD